MCSLGEMTLTGLMTVPKLVGELDMALLGSVPIDALIVPAESKPMYEKAWNGYWQHRDRSPMTFYGVKDIWEAIMVAFPDAYLE